MRQIDRRAFLTYMGAALVFSACGGPDVTTQPSSNPGNPDLVDTTPAAAPTESAYPESEYMLICRYIDREDSCDLQPFTTGAKPYKDRDRFITRYTEGLEHLEKKGVLIPTFNKAKRSIGDYPTLEILVNSSTRFYIAVDPRNTELPEWMQDFTKTEEILYTDDAEMPYGYNIYSVDVIVENGEPVTVPFGGNLHPQGTIAGDHNEESFSAFFVIVAPLQN